jgi:hypothetical protein
MKGRLLLSLCLAFALLLAVAPAAGAAGWGQKFSVSGQPGPETFSGPADVAVDAEGNATYVWIENSYGGSSNRSLLRSRVYGADGSVGPTRTLEEETGNNFIPGVSAGIDASGQVRIAWAQGTQTCTPFCTTSSDFYVAPLDANGEIGAEPLSVTTVTESFSPEARFEVAPDGESVLAVVNSGGSALELWRVSADVQSAVDESPEEPDTVLPSSLGLDVNGSGEAFIAWIVEEEGGTTSRIDAAIVSPGSETVKTMDTEVGFFGSITLDAAIDDAGNGTVVYSASEEVSFAQLMADGTVIAPQLVSPAEVESESGESAIDVADDGTVLVAWREEETVSARAIRPGGEIGLAHQIATEIENLEEPIVSVGPSSEGTVMFAAYEYGEESFLSRALARDVTTDGVPTGTVQTMDSSDEEWTYFYPLAIDYPEGGNAAAAWIREFESGPFSEDDFTELAGALRDATAPSLTLWVPDAALTGTETVFAAVGEDPNPLTYSWSFGDSAAAAGPIATHAFDAPGEYTVSVTATDALGNSATQSDTIEVVDAAENAPPPSSTPPSATPPAAAPAPQILPQTKVLRRPPKRSHRRRGVIRFVSSQADARFECRVDRGRWHNCHSPMRLRRLSVGGHAVRIRAVSADGSADESPALVRFRVLRQKRR